MQHKCQAKVQMASLASQTSRMPGWTASSSDQTATGVRASNLTCQIVVVPHVDTLPPEIDTKISHASVRCRRHAAARGGRSQAEYERSRVRFAARRHGGTEARRC